MRKLGLLTSSRAYLRRWMENPRRGYITVLKKSLLLRKTETWEKAISKKLEKRDEMICFDFFAMFEKQARKYITTSSMQGNSNDI